MMDEQISKWTTALSGVPERLSQWVNTPQFNLQIAAILLSVLFAYTASALIKSSLPAFRSPPPSGSDSRLHAALYRCRSLIAPLILLFLTGIAVRLADDNLEQSWLIRAARSLAFLNLLFTFVATFLPKGAIRVFILWIGVPISLLHVFGWLDEVTSYLDSVSLSVGDIRVSLYIVLRTIIFGALLFWLGRASNNVGKQAIRSRTSLDIGTREVLVKLFEITLYVVVFLLLLQVMGINLTALAVFGGALGVGLGFGLQQIASNFISGLIILLDRSVQIGDFIELEDGRSGRLRDLSMRRGVIETFDGKDIMIPNEVFITSSYTNWTHKDPKQRYPLNFQVAYSTDLDLLFDNIRKICAAHPKVISGDDIPIELRPDAEIAGFGDNGIDILVEFWMEGIDDGENRVGADLLHAIWRSIQENGMEIPFPQREVRILRDRSK